MYSPYILRYRYCRHVTLDVFWLKGKRRSETSKLYFHFGINKRDRCPYVRNKTQHAS